AMKMGASPQAAAQLAELEDDVLDGLWRAIEADRALRWSVVQRGFWVHGVGSFRAYLRAAEQFTLDGRIEQIRCPMLLTQAEHDHLAAGAQAFFDALRCP